VALGLGLAFFAILALFYTLVGAGQRGGGTFFSNPLLAISLLAAATSAIVAGTIGAIAIVGKRERSALPFLVVLIGGLVLLFVIGEVTGG
jgi:hypothetical protein